VVRLSIDGVPASHKWLLAGMKGWKVVGISWTPDENHVDIVNLTESYG